MTGKVELVFEGEQEGPAKVSKALIGKAVREVFKRHFPDPLQKRSKRQGESRQQEDSEYGKIIGWFEAGNKTEIADGKPSAIFDENGRLYKNSFGLDPRIVNKTPDEAVQCRREKIVVSTFMVARDPYLINFVDEFTKTNQGRAYYSDLNKLGEFIFVDYLRNRRKRFTAQR